MKYNTIESIDIQLNGFENKEGISDYHLLLSVTDPSLSFEDQITDLQKAYSAIIEDRFNNGVAPVFKRYFLSDAANQITFLSDQEKKNPACTLSYVQQPPLNGTKIALWVYLQTEVESKTQTSGFYEVSHNGYRHLWTATNYNKENGSESQTRLLLNEYILKLEEQKCCLAMNCVRTWFFVQNVDVNYKGVVKARKEVFLKQQLSDKTHYIASTGIEGRNADPEVLVTMDAYAVDGLKPEQIHFLYAPTHLNPTYEYGVTFERGVTITYGDRKHIFISGTASIDNQGRIISQGNVLKQAERMFENISALLKEAKASLKDIKQAIIYLRDPADYQLIKQYIHKEYPYLPHLIVWAPVCRPGWLIEMECIAITHDGNRAYRNL